MRLKLTTATLRTQTTMTSHFGKKGSSGDLQSVAVSSDEEEEKKDGDGDEEELPLSQLSQEGPSQEI